jgi:hypothetical protein
MCCIKMLMIGKMIKYCYVIGSFVMHYYNTRGT